MIGWLLLVVLAVYCGAHLAIVGGLAAAGRWRDAALTFFLPPLAPWWGWSAGMHRRVTVWAAALIVYTLGVAAA